MKKSISVLLCLILLFSSVYLNASATDEDIASAPEVLDFVLTTGADSGISAGTNDARVSGLILSYALGLAKNGNVLTIVGDTYCIADVVKSGYKDLVVQRRKTSDDSWSDYYDYGNVYIEAASAHLSTTLSVASGYQYRLSCKHYAKKNILLVQTISNTSNIVTVS